TPTGTVKVIGHNILQKTDRDGKISLVTNKTKSSTGMNAAIQKELGLINQPKKTVVRRTLARAPQAVRQAVVSDVDVFGAMVGRGYDPTLYKWSKPGLRPASQLIGSLEGRTRLQSWQNFAVSK